MTERGMERFRFMERVKLTGTQAEDHLEAFAADVESGLTRMPKSLPCRYFYDHEGSLLFEQICELPEYYLTRAERGILTERVDELVALLPEGVTLCELGSGSGVKTRILIEALLRAETTLRYVPIDISRSAIEASSLDLVESYEELDIEAFLGTYEEGLKHLRDAVGEPRLFLWLGSSIGNLDRLEATTFLRGCRASAGSRDHLLLGIDLRKARDILEQAYDDARGVTARFNKNLLLRINRDLRGHFDLDRFHHRAIYDEELGRVEMHLVSQRSQRVEIDALELVVEFEVGETIRTENCYKYSAREIEALVEAAGMRLVRQWFDKERRFSVNLLAFD